MTRISAIGIVLLAAVILASYAPTASTQEVQLPHTFKNGEVADAEQVNENFQALAKALDGGGASSGFLTARRPKAGTAFLQLPDSVTLVNHTGSGALHEIRAVGEYANGGAAFVSISIDGANPIEFNMNNSMDGFTDVFENELGQKRRSIDFYGPIGFPWEFEKSLKIEVRLGGVQGDPETHLSVRAIYLVD